MKRNDGTNDIENIKRFLHSKKLSPKLFTMQQVHCGDVAIVKAGSETILPEVDGLVTTIQQSSLCVITADCLPVLLFDARKKIIGAAHAGSKGLAKNILHNIIDTFKREFDSIPGDIHVTIGPSIEQQCYEVGGEVIERFSSQLQWFDSSFYSEARRSKYLLNLRKIALHSLLKEGILKEHIEISEQCTKCSTETLYSYRRGDKFDRFVSVISLI